MTHTGEQLTTVDRLIAEKVMGWTANELNNELYGEIWQTGPRTADEKVCWMPTRNIAQAWEVLEKSGHQFELTIIPGMADRCLVTKFGLNPGIIADVRDQSMPLAICLCALIAAGCEVPNGD